MAPHWEALVLRALGGRTFRLTVLDTEPVGQRYRRLHLDDGGLLAAAGVHPTMWLRLWFDDDGRPHQRAYTLVDPEPATGRFGLEFALHDGRASRWAETAAAGDTIEATLQGSTFRWPAISPVHTYLVGDAASLPAVNSLLDATRDVPATMWLEHAHEGELTLPVRARPGDTVHRVPRKDGGRLLVDTVRAELPAVDTAFYWLACEAGSTRALTRHLRRDLNVDRRRLSSLGYWTAT